MTGATIEERIGARVREARRVAGLTQAELGERIGQSPQAVHKLERGEIRFRIDHLYRIAEAVAEPVTFFLRDLPGFGPASADSEPSNAQPPRDS